MKLKLKKEIKPFLFANIGLFILAIAVNIISWRYRLVTGGMFGYVLILNYLFHFPAGISLIIINTLILIVAVLIAGKSCGIRAIYGYTAVSILIDITRIIFHLEQSSVEVSFIVMVAMVILQALIGAFGVSLIMVNKYSLGNYTTLWLIINKFYKIRMPQFFIILDIILVVITLFIFGIEIALLLLINAVAAFFAFSFLLKNFDRHEN